MYYARPISTLLTFVTTSSPSFPLLFLSPFFPFPFLPFLSSFPSFPFLLFLSSFPSFLLFLSLLSSPFLSFFIFCGASQHRKSAVFPISRLGPIKASPGVPLNPQGSGERCTFGSVRHKKGDILLECVIWGSGKLQCEAFIGPRRDRAHSRAHSLPKQSRGKPAASRPW